MIDICIGEKSEIKNLDGTDSNFRGKNLPQINHADTDSSMSQKSPRRNLRVKGLRVEAPNFSSGSSLDYS